MSVHIFVSETDTGIGPMQVRVIQAGEHSKSQLDRILSLEGQLLIMQDQVKSLETRVFLPADQFVKMTDLQLKVQELESRTWWSMLKEWVTSTWR